MKEQNKAQETTLMVLTDVIVTCYECDISSILEGLWHMTMTAKLIEIVQ